MCRSLFLVFLFLFLSNYVAPEENPVYEYGPDNFRQQIEDLDGNFIMFYAPWCHHCTDFHPIWSELGEFINSKDSRFAIAQVDCTIHTKLCQENDITGYPTLLYFHRNTFTSIEYRGTRDVPSLIFFLSEENSKSENKDPIKPSSKVKINRGMAYLNDLNIEKFISNGQHFVMFYVPWCKASQRLAPSWAELAARYAHNSYIQIGRVNCMENEVTCENFDVKQYPFLLWIVNGRIMGRAEYHTFKELKEYLEKMLLAENHDPDKFMKKKKVLPVARISEDSFETFMEKDLVFVNYFAPWCAHCMQLSPLWIKLGENFQNESRVLIADVDCARSKAICETEKINGLPTLILYKNKKVVNVENGGRPLDSLISLVKEHLEDSTDVQNSEENIIRETPAKDEL